MTRWSSSTLALARPKVPSWEWVLVLGSVYVGSGESTYPLLGELTGALVLGVAQQLNDAALVGGEAGEGVVSWCSRRVSRRCGKDEAGVEEQQD
jgi:hypothetical protein